MAYSVTITAEAMHEYEQIVSYLSGTLKSPGAAKGFADEFMRQINSVRENLELHALSRMPELAAKRYRSLPAMGGSASVSPDGFLTGRRHMSLNNDFLSI